MVKQIMNLKYYEGKICTILTVPINRNFKEESDALNKPELYPKNVLDYFTGRVVHFDNVSITIQHPILETKAYFKLDKVVAIVEEQELNPNNPEHAEIIKQYESKIQENKTQCPNGHQLNVPKNIENGSLVKCPSCNIEFILGKMQNSNFVDINMLKKISNS
jgi:hypothetical protein